MMHGMSLILAICNLSPAFGLGLFFADFHIFPPSSGISNSLPSLSPALVKLIWM